MWAAVGVNPLTVTVPKACGQLSEVVDAGHFVCVMTMSVEPERLPPTGGTSCAPVSLVMGIPWVVDGPEAHPPAMSAAIPRAPRRHHFLPGRSVGIVVFLLRLDRPADGNDRTGHQCRARKASIDARRASTL